MKVKGARAGFQSPSWLVRLGMAHHHDLLDAAWRRDRLAGGAAGWPRDESQAGSEGEKIRRRELVRDSKSALEQGLTLEQYVAKREQTVDD